LSCFVLVKKRDHAARSLKATIMNQPPDNYYHIHKNVIVVRDKKTKRNLIVSFTQFKDIEGKNEYADLIKLTKSLMQLKIGSNLVSSNGAQKLGGLLEVVDGSAAKNGDDGDGITIPWKW
jgi:hypothetical protein